MEIGSVMTAKYKREGGGDPDWVPLTPDIRTKKSASNRLIATQSTDGKQRVRVRTNTKTHELKTLQASLYAHQTPKILKKRRLMRKRMSLTKLIELTRMVHGLRDFACTTTLNLTWMNVKRGRSNTAIPRKDFSSPFASHVVVLDESVLNESEEQCKNLQVHVAEMGIREHSLGFNTRFQADKSIIVYKRKGKRRDMNSAVDFSKPKMDSDVPKQLAQNESAAVVSNCDDLSSSSFVALDPYVSEQNGRDGGNNCIVLETQQVIAGKSDESNPSSWVEEDLDSGNKANAMPARFEENSAWVPLTPSNCGKKSLSLLEILMKKSTPKRLKRLKIKRHNPKVFDQSKSMKTSTPPNPRTPNPRTPKPTRKVKKKVNPLKKEAVIYPCKRKLDFSKEDYMMDQEQNRTKSSSEPTIKCKRRSMMRYRLSREKLVNLNRMIHAISTVPDLNVSTQQEEVSCYIPSTCDLSVSIQQEEVSETKTEILEHSSEFKTKNVLLIQDEALKEAMEDYAVQKMASLRIGDDNDNSNAIVYFKGNTDPSKTHKATVDLDPETLRVWDILMGPNQSKSTEADAESVNDEEYMKGQRKMFREKVDLFLARMRVYQGDKRFSQWKGSVVDSIVGVFLTQNVSDHLSSSAYMNIASAFPPLSVSEQNSQFSRNDQQVVLEANIENGNESSSQIEVAQVTKTEKGKGKQKTPINWDELRKQYSHGIPIKRTDHNADSINWEAVRQSSATYLAKVIEDRGMSNQLAKRIKGFLDRLVTDHGSLDLEWLRNVPPPKAKDYLLSISGLGLKSTECVRLLSLNFPSFPVDTNAGRFLVRVGWVPLKPLPDSVHLHLLNQYPVLDSVQKYLWPRICDRDKLTLYEFHCHSVTFAKSFCTKTKPNCNHCPMRGECRHYASAFASSRLHLEGPQAKSSSDSSPVSSHETPMVTNFDGDQSEEPYNSCSSEPTIEFPASPRPEPEPLGGCIEDLMCDSEIPTIKLNGIQFSENIRNFIGDYDEISKALVAISPQVGSIPMPKLKHAIRLRTVHQVYELPDSHPLLAEFECREPEDPCPYLLAIWPTDETKNSESSSQESAGDAVSSREVVQYVKHDRVQGSIMIPCRTANRGRFPLNGTYFQTNEVFADRASSRQPIDVPRELIWSLRKRTLYCGTSITSICRGMSDIEVAFCFQRCFICIRAFDTKTRRSVTLSRSFHVCKSRQPDK